MMMYSSIMLCSINTNTCGLQCTYRSSGDTYAFASSSSWVFMDSASTLFVVSIVHNRFGK